MINSRTASKVLPEAGLSGFDWIFVQGSTFVLELPSGRFEIYPTDMNDNAKLLKYEDFGITPDIILRDDSNWIDQLIEMIKKK